MKDNITNKYLNVFQNYDKFSSESFNYIKGNDYVAFLINENQVIYWINLEVIWKFLGISVTDTGEKTENGDSIINVVLNGNNNIIYNYLPAIPDEERIKSLANFCNNYPYIENVKLDNTINLENINNAFRNLTLNSFSLNVSKVKTANHTFENSIINCDILLDFKNNDVNVDFIFNNVICKNNVLTINFNDDNVHHIYYDTGNKYSIYNIVSNGNIKITLYANAFNNYIKCDIANIFLVYKQNNTDNDYIQNVICNEFNLDCLTDRRLDTHVYYNAKINCKNLNIKYNLNYQSEFCILYKLDVVKATDVYIPVIYNKYSNDIYKIFPLIGKGSNIQIDKSNIHIIKDNDNNDFSVISSFFFKQPIIDDNFLKTINYKISLIQYKDDFQNISDIELYNSQYKDYCYLYFTDTSYNNNIIIKNGFVPSIEIFYKEINFKYLEIDTTDYYKDKNIDDYPAFNTDRRVNKINIEKGGYKGYYKITNSSYIVFYETLLNCTIYLTRALNIRFNNVNLNFNNNIFSNTDKIINFIPLNGDSKNTIEISLSNDIIRNNIYKNFDVKSFVYDNTLNFKLTNYCKLIFKYYDDIECYPTNIPQYIRYISNPNKIRDVYIFDLYDDYENVIYGDEKFSSITDVYLNFTKDAYIIFDNSIYYDYYYNIINFYGSINVDMRIMNGNYIKNLNFVHIDFSNIIGNNNLNFLHLPNLDESSIKKIPNALENNSSTEEEQKAVKIVSVYRSQYNYWNDNDINTIISKNYEIAITEN